MLQNGAVLVSNTQRRVMPTAMVTAYAFPSCNGATAATVCAEPTAGNAMQIYLAGVGKATPNGNARAMPLANGKLAPLTRIPRYLTVQTPTVTIGAVPTRVDFSCITPGNAGPYQINVVIPDGVKPDDEVPVVITMPNGDMDTVTVAVRS